MSRDPPRTFWEHIEELTKRLKVVLLTLLVSTIAILCIPGNLKFLQNLDEYEPWVSTFLRSIRERVLPPDIKLIAMSITDPIELYVIASLIFSFGITLPVFAYEVYKYVDPALYARERKDVYPFIAVVSILFVTGALFGFFFLFPFFIWSMFPFFSAVGAELIFPLMDFYSILLLSVVSMGLIFTFPAFFVLLIKYGIIHTDTFRQNRKYLYLGLVILSMFISPGASPQGNLILFFPMVILFEISMFFGRRYEKKGEVRHVNWFSNPKCIFCNAELTDKSTFCPQCKRSQA